MARIEVTLSDDALQAHLRVIRDENEPYPEVQSLYKALKIKGVCEGIEKPVLQRMCRDRVTGTPVVVARGKAAAPGTDARLEFLLDIASRGRPLELENGRVDHKELRRIINVKKGTPLVRHIPSIKGIPGISVQGKHIEPFPPQEVVIHPGRGVRVAEDDETVLVAEESGALSISAAGVVSVESTRIIPGDIDYSTGNITFNGTLEVRGTIKSGFRVQVKGDLVVKGSIEDAAVACEGDCHVEGGVVGGSHGKIVCGGELWAHHGENCTVEARGDVVFHSHCIHGKISCGGLIRAQTIVGGTFASVDGIIAKTIGAATETKTFLDISLYAEIFQKAESQVKKLGHLASEIQCRKDELFEIVRGGMDEKGILPPDEEEKLTRIKSEIHARREEYDSLSENVEQLKAVLQEKKAPCIQADEVQPNTVIRFGESQKVFSTTVTAIRVTVRDGKLVMAKV
ncbi:MAG: DUF342 domain-containing protein [Chitinivibrionales bacterium]